MDIYSSAVEDSFKGNPTFLYHLTWTEESKAAWQEPPRLREASQDRWPFYWSSYPNRPMPRQSMCFSAEMHNSACVVPSRWKSFISASFISFVSIISKYHYICIFLVDRRLESNAIEITPTFVFFKDLSLSSDTKQIYYTSNSSSMKTGSSEMGKLAN